MKKEVSSGFWVGRAGRPVSRSAAAVSLGLEVPRRVWPGHSLQPGMPLDSDLVGRTWALEKECNLDRFLLCKVTSGPLCHKRTTTDNFIKHVCSEITMRRQCKLEGQGSLL